MKRLVTIAAKVSVGALVCLATLAHADPLALTCGAASAAAGESPPPPPVDVEKTSTEALKRKSRDLQKNPKWRALLDDLAARGFKVSDPDKGSLGFSGELSEDDEGKGKAKQKMELAMYDIANPETGEKGALLWLRKGNKERYSYFTIPEGGTPEDADEREVGADGQVKKKAAGEVQTRGLTQYLSFASCIYKYLVKYQRCGRLCSGAYAGCYATALLNPLFPMTTFMACMNISCGSCVGYYALRCGYSAFY